MLAVGVIEIVAGIAVAVAPRYGALLVAGWLAGIIVNLVTMGDFYDIALRDFGLLVGALALAVLAFDRGKAAASPAVTSHRRGGRRHRSRAAVAAACHAPAAGDRLRGGGAGCRRPAHRPGPGPERREPRSRRRAGWPRR